ncbi:MAG: amino acid--[acyl-carrier-protein] ligase [Pararobbsia sp.]
MSDSKPAVAEAQPLDTARALADVLNRVATPTFRDELIDAGLLIPTGVDGLYGRSETFENVVEGINHLVTQRGADQGAEVMRFPPGMNRADFEDSEYLKSFPNLAGTVHSFCGGEREHHRLLKCLDEGEDWMESQQPTRVVLTPAACYPCYPVVARRGPLPAEGCTIDVFSYCFRHEPSLDPARMQMFRMREYVRMGTPEQIVEFRAMWIERGKALIETLGLPHWIDLANDPFFGRGGKIVADSQRAQALKFELLIPIESEEKPTACLSFNYHMDHFGEIWKFHTRDGAIAHTGCVGFGMERTTLAMFRHHGLDVANWPANVREALWGAS